MGDDNSTTSNAQAQCGRTTPCSTPPRRLPIIVVPGVMGTRLTDAVTNKLIWNPLSEDAPSFGNSPGPFAADVDRLADMAPLWPDVRNGYSNDESKNRRAAKVSRFNNLITDYYGDLCFALAEDLEIALRGAAKNVAPRVYCSGYDWRQDNELSASLLAKRVAQARRECDGEKCIVVAHSMGGLVSRYYCAALGGEESVRALFLLGSPSLGAVKPYVWLKEGISNFASLDDFKLKNVALGKTSAASRDLLRRSTALTSSCRRRS
jgi:pimeloyl-ACP methyl ester carboxylesterase